MRHLLWGQTNSDTDTLTRARTAARSLGGRTFAPPPDIVTDARVLDVMTKAAASTYGR